MLKLLTFTALGLAIGAVHYGHHSLLWCLAAALMAVLMLVPADEDERSADARGRLTESERGRGRPSPRKECLLEMYGTAPVPHRLGTI